VSSGAVVVTVLGAVVGVDGAADAAGVAVAVVVTLGVVVVVGVDVVSSGAVVVTVDVVLVVVSAARAMMPEPTKKHSTVATIRLTVRLNLPVMLASSGCSIWRI